MTISPGREWCEPRLRPVCQELMELLSESSVARDVVHIEESMVAMAPLRYLKKGLTHTPGERKCRTPTLIV